MGVSLRVAEMLTKVRRALASRYLFDNWLSLLIKYALTRLGFNVKLVARVGDCTFELSPEAFERIVSRFSRGLIRSVECNGKKLIVNNIEITNINDLVNVETYAKVLGWAYDPINQYWFKSNVKFKRMYLTIIDVFDSIDYEPLNVINRIVIDVGAFVGDSAIYFALRGAKKVIAIEPHPGAYAEMLDNIKLNNLENVIVPVNAGLASKPGKICIENSEIDKAVGTYYKPNNGCKDGIPVVTLNEIISKFDINPSNAVLKMDCEGCEFDVILNDYKHVRLFRELIFETDINTGSKLLKTLNKDYQCRIIKIIKNLMFVHCVKDNKR